LESSGRGDLDRIDSLVSNGTDINQTGPLGFTAINYARLKGRTEAVELLQQYGAREDKMPSLGSFVDSIYSRSKRENSPGSAIIAVMKGKVLINQAYGKANIEKDIPNSTDTRFRIGSITKQFTSAAILRLQEQGKINVNDPLSKYMSDFPRGDEVKIHHLLTHTSGIHSYTDDIDFTSEEVTEPINSSELIEEIKGFEFEFDPGEKYYYNNSAYFLLSHLIEQLSGKTYGRFLEEEFFKPLGMKNTGPYINQTPPDNSSLGYSAMGNSYNPAIDWDMSWAGGAGILYSTTGDLIKWNEGLFGGRVLSDESLSMMLTPGMLNDGSEIPNNYCFGIAKGNQRGIIYFGHSGGLPGFNSYLNYYPDYDLSVAVLTNCLPLPQYLNPAVNALAIAEYLLWEDMPSQDSFRSSEILKTDNLDDYAGRYAYPGGIIGTFTAEEGILYAQLTGQPKAKLYPEGNGTFSWKIVDARIEFVRDSSGVVTHGIHKQGGNEFKVELVVEDEVIDVGEETLQSYVGTYEMPNGAEFIVTREGKQLFAKLGAQSAYPVYPKSQTVFFYKVVVAELEFNKDNNSNNSSVTLKQAGREIKMLKK
jgi:CubicO group peptidase (beta-lactamase class C family)